MRKYPEIGLFFPPRWAFLKGSCSTFLDCAPKMRNELQSAGRFLSEHRVFGNCLRGHGLGEAADGEDGDVVFLAKGFGGIGNVEG